MGKNWIGLLAFCLAGLVVGLTVGSSGLVPLWRGGPTTNPQEKTLNATLWMQTSAEYEACCLQAYRLGRERLETKLAAPAPENALPPAVVMDLDETVLDNSPFQAYLIEHAVGYDDQLWGIWERDHAADVRLVPGAKGFIDYAAERTVPVFYISNRLTENRSSTAEAVRLLGLNTDNIDERLLLRDGPNASGNKTARRKQVEAKYRVLLFFGDNLRDFAEEGFVAPKGLKGDDGVALEKAIAERKQEVLKEEAHFGDDWIILPNPVYGEWTRLLGDNPAARLRVVDLRPTGR